MSKELYPWINKTFVKYRKSENKRKSNTFKLRPNQELIKDYMEYNSPYRGILLYHGLGSGKCMAKGTKLLMHDGSIEKIENIKIGDLLMGDDSKPRTVLSLATGKDKMYEIIPKKGDKYIVNSEHILCLKGFGLPKIEITNNLKNRVYTVIWLENNCFQHKIFKNEKNEAFNYLKNINTDNILEISVKDYLELSKKKKALLKGYKVKVDFKYKKPPFNPYIIGLWLGCESYNKKGITTQNLTVVRYLLKELSKYRLTLKYQNKYDYDIEVNGEEEENIFINTLNDLKLINNKHIPDIYKCNDEDIRIKVLAGIIDSCGLVNGDTYEIIHKNEKLIDDIMYLSRSLGFNCYKNTSIKNLIYRKERENIRINIDGNEIDKIPVLISRKQIVSTLNEKDLLIGINVKYKNHDSYYGFELDGNGRYLLGDFTVTHNTCTSIAIAEQQKDKRNILVLSPASLRSNYIHQLINDCGDPKYKKNSKLLDEYYTFIAYNASNTIEQMDKKVPSLDNHTIIIDEVHNLISMMMNQTLKGREIYNRLMNAKNCKIVALSGTPIINYPIEIAILSNILRGYIETSIFKIQYITSNSNNQNQFFIDKVIKEVIKHPKIFWAENDNRVFKVYCNVPSYDLGYASLLKEIEKIGENNKVTLHFEETKKQELFPTDEKLYSKYFVDETVEGDKIKNTYTLERRIQGLYSYFKGGNPIYYPKLSETKFISVPMSNYQFAQYKIVRDAERSRETKQKVKKILDGLGKAKTGEQSVKQASSLFRVFSRQYSNFVFPEDIERPFINKFIEASKRKKEKSTNVNYPQNQVETDNLDKSKKEIIDQAISLLSVNKEKYLNKSALQKYSPKMLEMLNIIEQSKGLCFVYSAFRSLEGLQIFSLVLETNGFGHYKSKSKLKYAIWSGQESEDERKEILQIFNSKDNRDGILIKVLMTTSAGAEGLDLKNIRNVLIMEPYWHEVRAQQVIGRANRFMSHIDLPEKDRTVDVYRFHTVLSKEQKSQIKDEESTDEYIYDIALKKMKYTNEIKELMKKVSIDCHLISKSLNCYTFPQGSEGMAYKPDLQEDIVYGTDIATKQVEINVKPYILDKKTNNILTYKNKKFYKITNKLFKNELKKPEQYLFIGIDDDNNVYDLQSVKQGNPIYLGKLSVKGQME